MGEDERTLERAFASFSRQGEGVISDYCAISRIRYGLPLATHFNFDLTLLEPSSLHVLVWLQSHLLLTLAVQDTRLLGNLHPNNWL